MKSGVLVLAAVLGLFLTQTGAALAQDAASAPEVDDWEFGENAASKITAAMVEFSGGQVIVVQCKAGDLSVSLVGVPQTALGARTLEIRRGDGRSDTGQWYAQAAGAALRSTAAAGRDARLLRGGGAMIVRSVAGDEHPVRMELELPAQSANLDRVLTACGRHLADLRDAIPRLDETYLGNDWLRGLNIGSSRQGDSSADISCVVGPELKPVDCRVEEELPVGGSLGQRLGRAVERRTLKVADPAQAIGRVFYFGMGLVTRTEPL